MAENPNPILRDIYPDLTDEELNEAEANLDRYLALVLRIFDHLQLQSNPQVDPLTPCTGTLRCTPREEKPGS